MEEILASIRRIISDDQDSASAPPPDAASASPAPSVRLTAATEDVLDLSEARAARPRDRSLNLDDEDLSSRDLDESDEIGSVLADETDPEPEFVEAREPTQPVRQARATPEPLLSETAQATAVSAFHKLSTTVQVRHPRTLEDAVTDMLRPMLKAWLDEHLPPLVERLVRAEIERVARGGP